VSGLVQGAYGLVDGALSLLTLVDRNGVKQRLPIELSNEEQKQLEAAHNFIQTAIEQGEAAIQAQV
ncbi:lactate dehydrogenase, partial [Staphylococcus simulans]